MVFPVLPLSGQEAPPPVHRVRVVAVTDVGEAARMVGLASLRADTLRLATEAGVRPIPVEAVRRLELSQGRRGHGRVGGLLGAGVGLAAGLTAVPESDGEGSTGVAGLLVPLSMAMYGGLGMLIGSWIRTERWEDVPVERLLEP
jgi:hypothetical protein